MITALAVPFADSRAADLRLVLDGAGEPPALAERASSVGPFFVRLRILGGSHQVLVQAPGLELSEIVACAPGADEGLPPERLRPCYRFRSRLLRPSAARLAELSRLAAARAGADPLGLAGGFPGRPGAITALAARPQGEALAWWSWHAYPEAGEAVFTVSRVVLGR
jgi:uncharacterized protein DUF2617